MSQGTATVSGGLYRSADLPECLRYVRQAKPVDAPDLRAALAAEQQSSKARKPLIAAITERLSQLARRIPRR